MKIPYVLDGNREIFDSMLRNLRRIQSSVYRTVYNQVGNGLSEKEIRAICNKNFNKFDSWLIQSAINFGTGQYKADEALAKKRDGVFSTRIFGTKKLFKQLLKGKISNREWKESRLEKLMVIGAANSKGNRKFIFNLDSIVFKINRKTSFNLKLPKLRGKYNKLYTKLVEYTSNCLIPVTVRIDSEFLYLSFDETKFKEEYKIIKNRYIGIDVNPNYIGVSYYNEHKELLQTQLYNLSKLTGKNINANKLKHEVRQIASSIGKLSLTIVTGKQIGRAHV